MKESKFNETPLFIIGNPRSGTSLLRVMLTSHPLICIPPECGYIQWWFNKYGNWSMSDTLNSNSVLSYIADLKSSKKIETWNLDFGLVNELIQILKPLNYAELCLTVIKAFASQKDKTPEYLGDKNNYYLNHLDLLNIIFPNAMYIGIIRDGRDVACSYRKTSLIGSEYEYRPVLPAKINEIAHEWLVNNEKINDFRKNIAKNRFLMIRFEDLVTDTKSTLESLSKFLSIEYTEQMLNYHLYRHEPEKTMAWKSKLSDLPDAKTIGQFKNMLSEEEVMMFNKIGEKILVQYIYLTKPE
jgi:hypothetical protein